jgi:hypothetical protein
MLVADARTARRRSAVMPSAYPSPEGDGFTATWFAFS